MQSSTPTAVRNPIFASKHRLNHARCGCCIDYRVSTRSSVRAAAITDQLTSH